ncbi:MAG: hypothetical protein LBT80_00925 [Lactobacillaceae bacterium]|jgi:hypothetical protein|nr:hypothetical protein [Lactobacillaceae bacterium]
MEVYKAARSKIDLSIVALLKIVLITNLIGNVVINIQESGILFYANIVFGIIAFHLISNPKKGSKAYWVFTISELVAGVCCMAFVIWKFMH